MLRRAPLPFEKYAPVVSIMPYNFFMPSFNHNKAFIERNNTNKPYYLLQLFTDSATYVRE